MENNNPFSLNGKVVLITGASSGIGRATAIECSRMGATLIITGRNSEKLNDTMSKLSGDGHVAFAADLCNADELNALVKSLPQLDGIVLSSGIVKRVPTQFVTREKLNQIFEINFFANIELIRLLRKSKKIHNGGSIAVLASTGGVRSHTIGNAMYDASKAAIASWVKSLSKELAPRAIRVNSVCPGMISTPMTVVEDDVITSEQYEIDIKKYLLQRYGYPEEVAYGVTYLLSDATKWVTGTELVIDGGITTQ